MPDTRRQHMEYREDDAVVTEEALIEEVSIDGMCGVY